MPEKYHIKTTHVHPGFRESESMVLLTGVRIVQDAITVLKRHVCTTGTGRKILLSATLMKFIHSIMNVWVVSPVFRIAQRTC